MPKFEKGHIVTPEMREKLRKANLGKKASWETREKLRSSHLGFSPTEETRKKISEDLKRKYASGERCGNKGRHIHTEKHKEELREITKKRLQDKNFGFKKGMIPWNKGTKGVMKANSGTIRKGQFSRDKHFNWKGGKSFEKYTANWTSTLKRAVRERDKYFCQICGRHQYHKLFDIHHIDYNKKNLNLNNLITLCKSCHLKTNYNRDKWIEIFEQMKGGDLKI